MLAKGYSRVKPKSIDLPLTNSLIPIKGSFPTFTRATTATVEDFEGLIKTVKVGEARCAGARRVENLAKDTENLLAANWLAGGSGTSRTATTVTFGGVVTYGVNQRHLIGSSKTYAIRFRVQGTVGKKINFYIADNITATKGGGIQVTFDGSVQEISFTVTVGETVEIYTLFPDIRGLFGLSTANTNQTFTWTRIQLEDVTGQANQKPSKYVSNGVLPPPYHGAGADGVEYFDTYNGNTVTDNAVTEATGATIPAATLAGVQIECASINYFLNSGTPATHTSVTLPTGTYTLWLDGSGSIAVSTGTATITGAGTATSTNQVTFTVTVSGTVTFTVTGTPTRGQCENNPMRTSYIPTTTAPEIRNVDDLTFQTTNNVSSSAGALYLEATPKFNIPNSTKNGYGKHWLLDFGNGTGLYVESQTLKFTDGTNTATVPWIPLKYTTYKIAAVWGATGLKVILNGVESAISQFTGNMNVGLNASIGKQASVNTTVWGGCIKNRLVYKHRISDSELRKLTA